MVSCHVQSTAKQQLDSGFVNKLTCTFSIASLHLHYRLVSANLAFCLEPRCGFLVEHGPVAQCLLLGLQLGCLQLLQHSTRDGALYSFLWVLSRRHTSQGWRSTTSQG